MKNIKNIFFSAAIIAAGALTSCNNQQENNNITASGLNPENFVSKINGKETALYTIKNKNGMEVSITNFGGRVVSIMVPDKNDTLRDVVLGFDNIKYYADSINTPSDFGAAIGRYANRINKGKITIDSTEIQLPTNNFGHCLHGGPNGWQYQVYDGKIVNDSTITMTMHSPDGDANFPGNVTAVVTYTLTSDNALDIKYNATTDKKTIINMTNHSYFNLSGDPNKSAVDHILYINADNYTPVDSTFMTTGEIASVKGTPMDFTTPHPISDFVTDFSNDQIRYANGYDHNWCLNTNGDINKLAAKLTCPTSGISLEMYTNEPGVQVYTGNFQDGSITGKKGIIYNNRPSVCLETQKYPDSPNHPQWPSPFLEPGEEYISHCIYKFTVEK